jgi:hypothetical protein
MPQSLLGQGKEYSKIDYVNVVVEISRPKINRLNSITIISKGITEK